MKLSLAGIPGSLRGLLVVAGAAAAFAQQPAVEVSPENHLDRESKDVGVKLDYMLQEVLLLKTELVVANFRQEFGDHIRMKRVSFPTIAPERESIPGYLFMPKDMPAGKKFPGLVMVHGGNHTQLSESWFDLIDEAVRRGYVVMYPEYRGSSGHGESIYENNYGVSDFADVRSSAAFLAAQPYVDPDRLGIFGHSRGGMLSMRTLEEEPKRFKAAVDVAGLKDMVAFMSYKTDARRKQIADDPHYAGKLPNQNLAAYIDVSPAYFVEKIETPVLVISTTGDTVVPYQLHNKRFIEALKAYGKVHETMLYENAHGDHSFIFGDNADALDARRRTFEWFGKYLKP
jgi:dipeptidyl aminopeptidase/acylaminoacyl peptidase